MMKDKLIDYFNGTLPPEQEASVQAWLSIHGSDKEVEAVLDSLFESSSTDIPVETDRAYSFLSGKLHIGKNRSWATAFRPAFFAIAGAVAAVCVCLPFAYKSGSDARYQEMSGIEWREEFVPYGQNRTVELSDGTLLDLRPGTRLIYPSSFVGQERKVFVEGEVYAKVTTNPDRPFVLSARDATVTVFGTCFNFKAYDELDDVEIMLFDGSVSFGIDSEKLSRTVKIEPGQVAQYDRNTGRLEVSGCNRGVYRALCEENALYYYNLSMRDIARDLEQRFGVNIIITSPVLADTRIFAMFTNNESLDEILSAIGAGRRMKLTRTDNTIYLK